MHRGVSVDMHSRGVRACAVRHTDHGLSRSDSHKLSLSGLGVHPGVSDQRLAREPIGQASRRPNSRSPALLHSCRVPAANPLRGEER